MRVPEDLRTPLASDATDRVNKIRARAHDTHARIYEFAIAQRDRDGSAPGGDLATECGSAANIAWAVQFAAC